MTKYVVQRLLQAIPLLTIVTIVVFSLSFAGGNPFAYLAQDPRARPEDKFLLQEKYGLNDSIPVQFVTWLIGDDWRLRDLNMDGVGETPGERQGILRGDFGESVSAFRGKEVSRIFAERMPNTLILMVTQYVVTIVFALGIGILAAIRQYSWFDNMVTSISFVLYAMPVFLVALLLVQVFAVQCREVLRAVGGDPSICLPVQGMYDVRGDRSFDELLRHLILPVVSLAAINIAGYSRYIRSTMLEVINSDYIRTARSKGLTERRITFLHALKNASLPLVTIIALDIPFLLGGAVITETIFSWPGMGLAFINAVQPADPPLLMAFTVMTAVAVVFFQLVADVLYSWLDPRIRYN
ncbi:MAG: ABC transporter permease [Anaerolineae bacterium]|jgi:peptide/nickel transport system permease protein|nr:ABC transporter permease [Anaerolineae bacterium]